METAGRRHQEEIERKKEDTKRQAKESEDREKAEAILLALFEAKLSDIRQEAEARTSPALRGKKFSSMLVKLEMQKRVLERLSPRPPLVIAQSKP